MKTNKLIKTKIICTIILSLFSIVSKADGTNLGGGGGSWVCYKNKSISWIQFIDLFEGKKEFGLKYPNRINKSEETIIQDVLEKTKAIDIGLYFGIRRYLPEIQEKMKLGEKPKLNLSTIKDANYRILPENNECPKGVIKYEQVVHYTFDNRMLVKNEFHSRFTATEKAALKFHEVLYFIYRQRSPNDLGKDSQVTRKLVALLFSELSANEVKKDFIPFNSAPFERRNERPAERSELEGLKSANQISRSYIIDLATPNMPLANEKQYSFSEGLVRFKNNSGKVGFMNSNGKIVVEAKYVHATDFHNQRAFVAAKGSHASGEFSQWSLVNNKGEVVNLDFSNVLEKGVSWKPKYIGKGLWAIYFIDQESRYRKVYNIDPYFRQYSSYVINANGSGQVLSLSLNNLKKIKNIDALSEDSFAVSYETNDGKNECRYYDKNAQLLKTFDHKECYSYSEGLAAVSDGSGYYGYMDKTGKLVLSMNYPSPSAFKDGLSHQVYEGSQWVRYIDHSGNFVIELKNVSESTSFSNGLARIDLDVKLTDREYGTVYLINKAGKKVVGPFHDIILPTEGAYPYLIPVKTGKIDLNVYPYESINDPYWQYVDREGKVVVPWDYGYFGFHDGYIGLFYEGIATSNKGFLRLDMIKDYYPNLEK